MSDNPNVIDDPFAAEPQQSAAPASTDNQGAIADPFSDTPAPTPGEREKAASDIEKQAASKGTSAVQSPVLPGGALPGRSMLAVPAERTPQGVSDRIARDEANNGVGENLAVGFAKGAGDTLENTVGKGLPGKGPQKSDLEAHGIAQSAGKIGENIMEFVAGDEALKGLGLADKLGVAQKIAKFAESHPVAAKLIEAGMNSLRGGTLSAGQQAVKGGSTAQVAGAGAAGLLYGAAGEALSAAAGEALATSKGVSARVIKTLNQVADQDGLPALKSTTARDAFEEIAQSYRNQGSALYKTVDDAVGGDLKPVLDGIEKVEKQIRINELKDPELAGKLNLERIKLENTKQALLKRAEANGVPNAQEIVDKGDKAWSQYRNAQRVSDVINRKAGEVTTGGHATAQDLAKGVDIANNSRKQILQKAFGQSGAEAVKDTAKAALSRSNAVKTTGKIAGGLAGTTTVGAAGYAGYKKLTQK